MDDFKRAMEKFQEKFQEQFQEQFQAVLSMIETQAEQIHKNMLVLKDDLERLRSIDVEDDMEADSAHFEDASESEGINSEADSFPSLCDDVNNSVSLVNENEMHLEVENSAYKVFDESPEIISDEIRTEIEAQFSDIYICETILCERLAQKIAIHEVSDVIVEMDDSKNLFSRHFKDEVGSLSLDVHVENSSGEVIAFQFCSDIVYFDDFLGQKSLKGGVLGREMVIECFGWKPGWVLVIRTMDRELFVINTRKIWTKKRWMLSFVFEWKPGLRCSSMGKLRKELKNGWKDGEVGVIKNDMIQVVFSGFELHELQELKSVMSDLFCGRSDGAYLQMRYSAFSTERAEPECEIDAFNLHSSGLPNKKGTRIQKFKLHSSRLPNKKGIRIQKHLKDWFWLFFELHKGNCEVASLDDVEKRVPAFDFED